ncbi:MAG TPA: type II toxin-antitoxin system VapC family toxin [Verrucomicrobiae bacterium]|nr:type II toxin-antitoxin system VapC family toxin [Verrucomicrobiae bacterium]
MMYLDTAIIVKLLVREPESEWFSQKLTGEKFVTSELALAEIRSALLSKERGGFIQLRERVAAMEKFNSMLESESIRLLPLDRLVVERASAIQNACHPHIPLKTLDALHVASCDLHHGGKMCATDRQIRAASKQLGFTLMPRTMEDLQQK